MRTALTPAKGSDEIHIAAVDEAVCDAHVAIRISKRLFSRSQAAVSAIVLCDSTNDAIQTASATRREPKFRLERTLTKPQWIPPSTLLIFNISETTTRLYEETKLGELDRL